MIPQLTCPPPRPCTLSLEVVIATTAIACITKGLVLWWFSKRAYGGCFVRFSFRHAVRDGDDVVSNNGYRPHRYLFTQLVVRYCSLTLPQHVSLALQGEVGGREEVVYSC